MRFRNTSVKLLAAACVMLAIALGLGFAFNHAAFAQQSGDNRPAPLPTTAPAVRTYDDRLADVARLVPSFGGFFIGDDGRLQVYLLNTSHLPAALQAIVAVFGRGQLPLDEPVALQARYNFTQLKAWHDLHQRETLALPGVSSVDIDEMHNRLEIGVSDYAAVERVRQTLERLSVPAEAVTISAVAPMKMLQTLRSKWRPIAGGIQITSSLGNCTLGFLAVVQNKAGFITNSHCTMVFGLNNSEVITQANGNKANTIGVEQFDPPLWTDSPCPSGRLCRRSDATFIGRDAGAVQPSPLVEGDFGYLLIADLPNAGVPVKHRITSRAEFSVAGAWVDKVGRTTGRTHGKIIGTCVTTNQANPDGTDTGRTMICQNVVDAVADGGDSGSPVYNLEPWPDGSTGVRLHGILWGGTDTQFAFSPLWYVDNEMQWSGAGSLKVFDGDNPSSLPMIKIRKPANNATVDLGGINGVDFEADAVDYEDKNLKLTWVSSVDGLIGIGKKISYSFTTPGKRKITVTAKDDEGHEVDDEINITVAENTAPVMTIKTPFANQELYKGVTYTFEGSSYDPDEPGDTLPCSKLAWTSKKNGGISVQLPLGNGCTIPAKFTSLGQYTIMLIGTDAQGLTSSAQKTIKVIEPPATGEPIVTITKPAENEMLLVDELYTFKGSATDPNYTTPMQYIWELELDGVKHILATGTATNGQTITLNWKPTKQGLNKSCKTYLGVLKLRVTDADGEIGVVARLIYIGFGPC